MWFIGVEVVEQETSAPPPKKNPGSAPGMNNYLVYKLQHYIRKDIYHTNQWIETWNFSGLSSKF